jgi:hypothetical protein
LLELLRPLLLFSLPLPLQFFDIDCSPRPTFIR